MSNLPQLSPFKEAIKATKGCSGTRTSDTLGSCYSTDINSYLKLIVRKVTEKCGTCQELMNAIRRVKLSENSYVTPIEFRYTLIKFGVTLPQQIVDAVFNVFDSDRSGTMDFDEFAMWIMNADVKPYVPKKSSKDAAPLSPLEEVRKKLNEDIDKHPQTFTYMKRKISFMELISDITRINMKLNEKDIRAIYLLLDPKETGFVESKLLLHWAKTGSITILEKAPSKTLPTISIHDAVMNITGRNPKSLQKCFANIRQGEGTKMKFDEFRQSLLASGLGLHSKEPHQLFAVLSEGLEYADIDKLLNYIASLNIANFETNKVKEPFKISDLGSSFSYADRRLRETMRKGFKHLKQAIEETDKSRSGFIDSEVLHGLINKYCAPICYADYRLILKKLPMDDSNRINLQLFLQEYNPGKNALPLPVETKPSPSPIHTHHLNKSLHKHNMSTDDLKKTSSISFDSSLPQGKIRPKTASAVSSTSRGVGVGEGEGEGEQNSVLVELRRKWTIILRECQRSDPERNGVVSRKELSKLGKSMTPEFMNKLADTYTIKDDLIDYLSCFRNYLNELISVMPSSTPEFKFKTSHQARSTKGNHPWDFSYNREPASHTRPTTPYWRVASQLKPPEFSLSSSVGSLKQTNFSKSKSSGNLNDFDREAILNKYDAKVINVCSKCHDVLFPIWRNVRNEFKRTQINSKNGCILASTFIAILEHFGLRLSSTEMGVLSRTFREPGTYNDVIRYDDFLRVCLVVKAKAI